MGKKWLVWRFLAVVALVLVIPLWMRSEARGQQGPPPGNQPGPPGMQGQGPPGQGPPGQGQGQKPPRPPREAIAACQGRPVDSACVVKTPQGDVRGSCRSMQNQLVCVPAGDGPGQQQR